MANKKNKIPVNDAYILPSDNDEMEKFASKFQVDMMEHVVDSIEFAIRNNIKIIELFEFKNSDYIITIADKEYDANLLHIQEYFKKCNMLESCNKIENLREQLKNKI